MDANGFISKCPTIDGAITSNNMLSDVVLEDARECTRIMGNFDNPTWNTVYDLTFWRRLVRVVVGFMCT
jgi:hypothetical protein